MNLLNFLKGSRPFGPGGPRLHPELPLSYQPSIKRPITSSYLSFASKLKNSSFGSGELMGKEKETPWYKDSLKFQCTGCGPNRSISSVLVENIRHY